MACRRCGQVEGVPVNRYQLMRANCFASLASCTSSASSPSESARRSQLQSAPTRTLSGDALSSRPTSACMIRRRVGAGDNRCNQLCSILACRLLLVWQTGAPAHRRDGDECQSMTCSQCPQEPADNRTETLSTFARSQHQATLRWRPWRDRRPCSGPALSAGRSQGSILAINPFWS